MRRSHAVLLLAAGLALALPNAAHPATRHPCTAQPGRVTRTATGIRAGRVRVTCAHAWRVTESVMYRADGSKWIFGGVRRVRGVGDQVVAAWRRPYGGCGYWRLRARFADGTHYDGETTEFCGGAA